MKEAKQEVLLTSDEVVFKAKLNQVLEGFREELDDHREAINENTTEIEANHEFLQELNSRLDKMSERLDELTLLVKGEKSQNAVKISPLTKREKDVFQAVYSLGEGVPFVTYREVADKLGMAESLVANFVTNMLEKGVPVLKRYSGGRAFINLDPKFREKQAKENIIGVNTLLTYWVH